MSESSLLTGEVEDVDLEDNALQDLIQEAESLMNDLPLDIADTNLDTNAGVDDSVESKPVNGTFSETTVGVGGVKNTPKLPTSDIEVTSADTRAAINIGGNFSIDDDYDDVVDNSKSRNSSDLKFSDDPLRAVEPTVAAPTAQPELDDHPLSAAS